MYNYAKDLIDRFGYQDLFKTQMLESAAGQTQNVPVHLSEFTQPVGNTLAIGAYNQESQRKSMYNLFESDEVTSIMINYPALLLRKKSVLYPEGRTSYRFKHALRK
jgi:hypothetical protein